MIYEAEEGLIKEGTPRRAKYLILAVFVFAFVIAGLFIYALLFGPRHFNLPIDAKFGGIVFEVKAGSGASAIGRSLKNAGVISSGQMFNVIAQLSGDTGRIKPGYYLFKSPTGALEAEMRIAKGDFGIPSVKLTFPEGFTKSQIADRLEANLPFFDKAKFTDIASTSEGYLFPETYFFVANDDEAAIFQKMRDVFREKTKAILPKNATNTMDVIKMASILEREVRGAADMKIVSGIFWKRISIGMALQADSTLDYERDKTSAELTGEDLKLDSPYNSYTRRGLPPTPIGNPGLPAIIAAESPTASPYLYFLTDKDGNAHYAKTFEEHKRNKAKYL